MSDHCITCIHFERYRYWVCGDPMERHRCSLTGVRKTGGHIACSFYERKRDLTRENIRELEKAYAA